VVDWENAQKHEAEYWGNCLGMRAWGEFVKGEMYGREMGLFDAYGVGNSGDLNMQRKSVLDIGGGPVSMTLRCVNAGKLVVVDPCEWPASVHRRYENYGIEFVRKPCEELNDIFVSPDTKFDEVWCYNVLQHVQEPAKIVENALARVAAGGVFRIFEWIHIPAGDCHPHVLTPEDLLTWLKGSRILQVRIPHLQEFWSDAYAFCGVFGL
jgi:2-polyprenyl-3-methyl-5-hydroxy-6-metoxy-1,4-benzoquinol methylase